MALRWPEPRLRALAAVAVVVTETPWLLTRELAGPLDDDQLLHAIALAAYFGHLNRIADAVAVALDYTVQIEPPRTDPSVPVLLPAPSALEGEPVLAISQRPATATAFAAWRSYLIERETPRLDRDRRAAITALVTGLVGAGPASTRPIDAVLELATLVTLAPWRLSDRAFEPLRAKGFTDADLFDLCVVASSTSVWARVQAATLALGRVR
ncbi:MAG: hypothetical protein WKG01_33475 [Kofleriaceae bacterium]